MQNTTSRKQPNYFVEAKADLAGAIFQNWLSMMEALKNGDQARFYNMVLGFDALLHAHKDPTFNTAFTTMSKKIAQQKHILFIMRRSGGSALDFKFALDHLKLLQMLLMRRNMFPDKKLTDDDLYDSAAGGIEIDLSEDSSEK